MSSHAQNRTQAAAKRSFAFPLVLACSVALALVFSFGSPALWAPASASTQEGGHYVDNKPYSLIAEYKAVSQNSNEERAHNISVAAETIHKYVIEPGETFSFNEVVGNVSEDERYQLARVSEGLDDQNIKGGGISQVATALYIAGLKADMEVVERHPHSVPTDYAPIGLDAYVVYPDSDLKLKNRSAFPITIEASATGQSITIGLYGEPLENEITIDAFSRVTEQHEESVINETESGSLETKQLEQYVVESYRVFYEGGVKSDSELLYSDNYTVVPSAKTSDDVTGVGK